MSLGGIGITENFFIFAIIKVQIMKKFILSACAVLLAISAFGSKHFISDGTFRKTVQKDYQARLKSNNGSLKQFMTLPGNISAQEKEALEFLYAYMPLADVTDYPAEFYLANVRKSLQAREEMPWKVPEREFRHFVLPLRTNNEDLDSARLFFYDEIKPRVEKLSMALKKAWAEPSVRSWDLEETMWFHSNFNA